MRTTLSRRTWMSSATAVVGTAALAVEESVTNHWRPNYILSSALYGPATLPEILPEVAKTGATSIDLWPKPHGTQREEIESRGVEQVQQLLEKHDVRLGGIACYRPGAFKLDSELAVARQLGDAETVLVTMAPGDCTLCGEPLDAAIQAFLSKLSPAIKQAESGAGIIAIENHSNSLLNSPESIRRFAALVESDHIGIALAPHHLPQDGNLLADLAGDAGSAIKFVYAQQYGNGSSEQLPKKEDLLQLPGRGSLDFKPLMQQLSSQRFNGPVEIFMHPVPRGVPILNSIAEITAAVRAARAYLDGLLAS
ncbi:MAG: TIM barrel protein [Planctomycetota bacterium]|nr:TIM barrel protein [Planctomycetota bacterium]